MKFSIFLLRSFFISPEVIVALLPFAVFFYAHDFFYSIFKLMSEDWKWSFGSVAFVGALLVYNVKKADRVLSPKGRREILLEWPDYHLLKATVLIAVSQSIMAAFLSVAGFLLLFLYREIIGVCFIFSGILVCLVTALTMVLAVWRSRELLRE